MRRSVTRAGAAAFLLAFGLVGEAQSPNNVEQLLPVMCPALTGQLATMFTAQPQMGAALRGKSLDQAAICGCASQRFLKDREIARMANLNLADLQKTASNDRDIVGLYSALRAVQYVLGCLAEDLDQKLSELVLPLPTEPKN
jgi:hypothetical protein